MRTLTDMLPKQPHTTSKGEVFGLTLKKKRPSEQDDYRRYLVEVTHEAWRNVGFAIHVTWKHFASEDEADHLAKTLAMEEVKRLLEDVTEERRPLCLPVLREGWSVL